MNYKRLEISPDILMQYVLDARRSTRHNSVGGHITRNKGQSLEFRDYIPYTIGQDFRHVDFRATVRKNGIESLKDPNSWLMRDFHAEEHLKLFITIDPSDTMRYPQVQHLKRGQKASNMTKLQIALWLAEALSLIAFQSHDQIIWHPLFINEDERDSVFIPNRSNQVQRPYDYFKNILDPNTAVFNQIPIQQYLKPAYVWIVISDFYFQKNISQFIDHVHMAQKGNRWVILIDLDTWEYEKYPFEKKKGFWRLWGASVTENAHKKVYPTIGYLQDVKNKIIKHKQHIFNGCVGADRSTWVWKKEAESADEVFSWNWERDLYLKRLFMRTGL